MLQVRVFVMLLLCQLRAAPNSNSLQQGFCSTTACCVMLLLCHCVLQCFALILQISSFVWGLFVVVYANFDVKKTKSKGGLDDNADKKPKDKFKIHDGFIYVKETKIA